VRREVQEETGLVLDLAYWKVYQRTPQNRKIIVDQYIYIGATDKDCDEMTLTEGQALRFVKRNEINSLPIAYDFDKLVYEYLDQQKNLGNR
jgi:8-oxo-dGTP pyrophosphatase MutT (NUDIX family)